MKNIFLSFIPLLFLSGCATFSTAPEAKVDRGLEEELPPYSGKRARLMVAKFGWETAGTKKSTRIKGPWVFNFEMTEEESGAAEGLKT
ncbi:MAG TPA: hypothetical protein VJC03_00680, partial [bacterium]|nr:hypothetical protein [bacterium]